MAVIAPKTPVTGKNSKVLISINDGILVTLNEMTKQSSERYRGKLYTNQIYTLGTGKTLINIDPEKAPDIFIDGALEGMDVTPGAAVGTLDVSAGVIEYNGTEAAITAATETLVDVVDPVSSAGVTASFYKYASIYIEDIAGTPAVQSIMQAGTGVSASASLSSDFGTGVDDKPLIPTNGILLAVVVAQRNAGDTAFELIQASTIDSSDREFGSPGTQLLPNMGAVLLTDAALVLCHTGGISRPVKFTGRYLDASLALISTAKNWEFTPSQNTISDETFAASYSITEMGAWSFSFEQLAADDKIWRAMKDRGGNFAIRVLYPNGKGYQSVATGGAPLRSAVGEMLPRNVTGSLADEPEEYDA